MPKILRPASIGMALILATGQLATAGQTHFAFKQISVNGSTNVYATAINNKGTIAGAYISGLNAYGFILHGGMATVLPAPCTQNLEQCVPIPTAINGTGTVAGYWITFGATATYGFTWQPGSAILANSFLMQSSECFPCQKPWLSERGIVAFSALGGGPPAPGTYVGPPSSLQSVPGLESATVQAVNRFSALSGIDTATIRGKTLAAVFTAHGSTIRRLVPPYAASVGSALINDADEVVGAYQDTAGLLHGFTHQSGKFTTFDMPLAAISITLNALNEKGRAVGWFIDSTGVKRPFLYNGTKAIEIGHNTYDVGDTLNLAIDDEGVMILGDMRNLGSSVSYHIRCAGPGC